MGPTSALGLNSNLATSQTRLLSDLQKLSTAKAINSAADNAAGAVWLIAAEPWVD